MGRDFNESYPFMVMEPLRLQDLARDYKNLIWVSWQGLSSEYLPKSFYLHDAVAIDVIHSLLRFVWKKPQVIY